MTSRIAVQVLVGANEEPFLPYAMKSVGWADYFTVVNTNAASPWGRTNEDIVEKTCLELKKPLRYAKIASDKNGLFSFADARNQCLIMTDPEDFVFIVDSDDVHYPEWEKEVRRYIEEGADSITAHYYHLMVYKDIFQFTAPREIIYKNYEGTYWAKGVHEQLVNKKTWPVVSPYHYMHYGYIKPQAQIFDRWKLYSDIEGDFTHYEGQDPNHIVTDRLSVSKSVLVPHPPSIQTFLEAYPCCPAGALKENWEKVPMEKAGLVLLTYNDRANLEACLSSLTLTHTYPSFEVLAIDLGSTDGSLELLDSYMNTIEMQVFEVGELIPLAEALNFGFNQFRQRHDIQYIGWIHPDMIFESPDWLYMLCQELRAHPKIGKICSANTRDTIPDQLQPGHEQCYIIRKDIVNKVGLFDEGYVGIGGYEDWDYNRRIINHDGYKVMITPRSKVFHVGMATRSRRSTELDQIANGNYYAKKWGSSDAPC